MDKRRGAVAQLGEHLLCKQGVTGSIPVSSTTLEATRLFLHVMLRDRGMIKTMLRIDFVIPFFGTSAL